MVSLAIKAHHPSVAALACLFILCGCGGYKGPEITAITAETAGDDAQWRRVSLDRAFTALYTREPEARLRHFRTLHPQENLGVLDAVLARLFPEGLDRPGEAEILRVLSYVAQTTELKSSGRHLGSEVLRDGHAYCYGMARAFESLCRRMGFAARINALHNFEWMQAHNMAEVYYDDGWHLFDPTYGVFFYTRPTYDKQGRIPAAREILSGSVAAENAFQVCSSLWTGRYDPDGEVRVFPDDFRYGQYAFTVTELYEHVLANAFPYVQSDLDMESFPIDIDMEDKRSLALGTVDGSIEDLYGRLPNRNYPRHYGAPFLGHMVLGPAFHTISFKASTPGRFRLTYHFLPQSRHTTMGTVALRDVIIDGHEQGDKEWSVVFKLQSTEGLFLVVNRQDAAYLDAISVTRLD